MSRPIIQTKRGPNRRRQRDLTVLAVVVACALAALVIYLEFFHHPGAGVPLPGSGTHAAAVRNP